MRPRVFPAEDEIDSLRGRVRDDVASMRPRVFPAEDPPCEVTAICRSALLQ